MTEDELNKIKEATLIISKYYKNEKSWILSLNEKYPVKHPKYEDIKTVFYVIDKDV
jgi:hypothetical protein